ncbi:unnamed protein product [Symbiodinium necroappetens]|uniref:CCHC-type domain-containing protein n=1 Tax=Symbiodinium necroappetens TaxID=1628268 RepID=A0A812XZE7_9DINO|nr:unnamed protein product [Symbiodinium necroappetens]
MSELRFTKDGVPIFDGSPEQYVSYKRAALVYAETVEWKKKMLAGPRLQAALEGSARMSVEHMPPGWVSHEKGAKQLLEYLKLQVRAPTLAEAKRTLAEAIHEYGPSSVPEPPRQGSRRGSPTAQEDAQQAATPEDEGAPSEDVNTPEADEEWYDEWWQSWPWYSSSWESSSGYNESGNSWQQKETLSQKTWDVSEAASAQAERFLPDFVIAWLLLQRSGLDSTERSVIVANLKNQFRTDRVKEALKLTWPDDELRRRDSQKQTAMFTTEETAMLAEDDDTPEEPPASWDDPADDYAYQALESEAQEAYAAIQDGRRTLREAREKQAMMRRNRNFYSGKGGGKGGSMKGAFSGGTKPPVKCFSCGGPHLRRDCPHQGEPKPSDQGAHLVFHALEVTNTQTAAEPKWDEAFVLAAQSEDEHNLLALDQIIKEGKAIIDGGDALQQLAALNWEREGDDGLQIVPGETPSFRFGNNGRHDCLSTALLNLRLGGDLSKMRIHLHDIPGQPVLLSVKGLRALGAVIDFEKNEAVFKNVDATRVATLETTASGHQLFPLAGDALKDSYVRKTPFQGLKSEGIKPTTVAVE